MTQEIKPAYVTFEQAKLLKSKGFKLETNCYYFEDYEFCQYKIVDTYGYYGDYYTVELDELYKNWNDAFLQKKNGHRCFGCSKDEGYFETFSAPEQWQVVEWLRVNHNIFIQVVAEVYIDGTNYLWNTINLAKDESTPWYGDNGEYNTPQEAYSAAFDYILKNNLI